MHSPPPPGPKSEQYRKQVQKRMQDLLSGKRSRNAELSQLSTGRLILEGVVEEVRIYRLRKEEKARQVRENSTQQQGDMAERDKGKSRERGRRQQSRPPTRENHRSRSHGGQDRRRQDSQEENEHDSLVSGETDRDDNDQRYMMRGALPSPHPDAQGQRFGHPNPRSQSRGRSPERGRQPKERLDVNGKPKVRTDRGWRDASVGPPPKYEFKKELTLGFGTHVKNCMQWGKEDYTLRQKTKERRARGSLEERRQARKDKKTEEGKREKGENRSKENENEEEGEEEGEESKRKRRGPRRHEDNDHNHKRHEDGRGHQSEIHNSDGLQNEPHKSRHQDRKHSSPETRYTPEQKVRAEAKARSRGDRLAKQEAQGSQRESGQNPPPVPRKKHYLSDLEPHHHVHFNSQNATTTPQDFILRVVEPQPNASASNPPYPTYEVTQHSHSVEAREREQQLQVQVAKANTTAPNNQLLKPPTPHTTTNTTDVQRLHSLSDLRANSLTIINRDAQDRENDDSSMVTDWWSVCSDTSSENSQDDETDDYSDDGTERANAGTKPQGAKCRSDESMVSVEQWLSHNGELLENSARGQETYSEHATGQENAGQRGRTETQLRVPEDARRRPRSVSPVATDGGDVFAELSAHIGRGK